MKNTILIMLLFAIVMQSSHAQVSTDLLVQTIDQRVQCEEVYISGANSWVPFTLKLYFPQTASLPEIRDTTSKGEGTPDTPVTISEKSLTFFTNSTYQYQFDLILNYANPAPGTMISEYWSNANLVSKYSENLDGLEICKRFIITTTAPPKFPTLSQILTDAGMKAVDQFQYIVPELINVKGTIAINTASFVVLAVVMVILLLYLIKTIQKIDREKIASIKQIASITKGAETATKNAASMIKMGNDVIHETQQMSALIRSQNESFMDILRIEFNSIMLDMSKKLDLSKMEEERITRERLKLKEEKQKLDDEKKQLVEKFTTVDDERQSKLVGIFDQPGKWITNIINLGKTEKKPEMVKADDFGPDDEPSDDEMATFYDLNEYEVNQELYRKYFVLVEKNPNNSVLKRRRDALLTVLQNQHAKMGGKKN